jgi:filamentous hemagglutinin family protein
MTLGQRLRTTTALHAVAAVALIAAPLPAAAQLAPDARPTGGQVVAGQASIGRSPTTTTISQSSQRAAVNWQSFDVGSQQTVQFNQPSSSAVTLNRVVGPNPSEIAGRIQANGQLVVVNQAGVVFSRGSQVNAAGLVVSAAGISDGNFMAGKMVFDQAANPNARIENRGTITVKDHGLAALVAPQVRNSGTIQAKMGTVILAGAEAETLDLYGDGLVTINVTKQVRSAPDGTKALVTNTGTIAAKGGSVVLTADAVDGVVQTLVDAGGHISADSTPERTGRVLISGSGGDVRVEGVVTAQGNAPGLAGGTVQVSGSNATIVGARARISASGQAGGGTIALGTTLARAQGNATGIAAATTKTLVVRKGATISADATAKGGGGRVVLLSSHSTSMAGTIAAKGGTQGGDGGFVEVSGGLLTLTGHVDASAPVGNTGTLLLDPSNLWVSDTKPSVATSWVSPALLESENANISLAATDQVYVASTYMGGNTLNLGSHTLSLTGGTGLTIDRGFTIDASRISLTTLAGTIALDGASGVAGGLITTPQLAMLSDTGLAAPVVVMAGAGGIALGAAMLGSAGTPLGILDLSSSGGGVTQDAGGSVFAGTLQSTGGVAHGVHLAGTANAIGKLGTFTAGTGFTLNDDTARLTVVGAVKGGPSVSLTNTGSLVIGAAVTATGTVGLYGDGITQTNAGVITAGTLTGDAGGGAAHIGITTNDVADLGTFSAGQGFGLRDDVARLKVTGAVDGGIAVYIVNTGSVLIGAPLTASGIVDLHGNGITQTTAGVVTAGTLTGDSGTAPANIGITTNNVATLGVFHAGDGFGLRDDTPTLKVAGAVDGGIAVYIVNSGSVVIGAPITATGIVDLNGNGIAQTAAGIITAGTLIGDAGAGAAGFTTAKNVVSDLGRFAATTGFGLKDAVGTLTVTDAVDGGTGVALTNTGSLAIDAALTATGTVALMAAGIGQDINGIITAGTLTGSAGADAARFDGAGNKVSNLGPFTAGNGFALNDRAAGLTVVGAIHGGPSVSLTNTGSLAIDAPIGAAGTVTLNASGIAQAGGGIITASKLTGSAGSGAAALGVATNMVGTLGPFTAATGFDLNDGVAGLTVTGAVDGGSSVRLANTGSLVLHAPVSATGLVTLDGNGIVQNAAGVITAARLAGNAGAGGAQLGQAVNAVTDLGGFSATDGFTLNDSVSVLTVADTVNGGSQVQLTNTGALVIGAAVDGTGRVKLDADGISQTAAGIITAGTLTGDADGGVGYLGAASNVVAQLGPFTAGTGFTLTDNAPKLTVAGAVDGGTFVTLTNTGSLAIQSAIDASNTVTLDANGISQTAAGVITAGTLTGNAGTGAADLGTATNLVANLDTFTATTGFTLNDAVGTLKVAGAVGGGTSVSLTNTGSLVINAGVSGTGTVALAAVGISQDASGVITAGTLTGTSGSGAAQLDAASNAVSNLGPFTAGGGFALNNDTPALTVVGAIDGGPSVTLTNTGSLALDAAIDPTNTVTLNANGITQTAAGVITAGTLTGSAGTGSAALGTASNLVTNLGAFTAATGFTLNDAVATLTVAGAVDGGTGVSLTNTGNLVINAGVSGTGTVALTAVGISQDAAGVITAGTLTGTAGSGAAQLDGATNAVSNLGPFTADAGFALNDDTPALSVVGAIDGGPSVTLTNTGSLELDAAISGTTTVALNANGITQTAGGIITTASLSGAAGNGSADLGTAANVVGNLGPFSAATGFTLNDTVGTLAVAGAVNGGTGVSLTNTGSLVINAAVSGTDTVGLTAVGISQDVAGVITAGTLTGTAGSGAAALGTATNVVTNLGPFTAGAGLTLNDDTPALTVIGAVDGGPTLSLTNTGSLAVGAALAATGTVSLTANGISQTVDGAITAGTLIGNAGTGDADLAAATNMIANLGPFTAAGTFQLLDGTGLAVIGNVTAGGDATIGVTGNGNGLVVNSGVTVQAESGTAGLAASGGDITNNGSVVGAVLAMLTASHDIDQNDYLLGDAITETAGHDINHAGHSDSLIGTNTLIAGNDIVQTGSVLASTGSTVLTAGHDLTQSGVVNGNIDSALTATTGTLTQSGTVEAGINTTLVAGTDLFQSGLDLAIQGAASLAAGGSLMQSSIVKAGGDATLEATSGALTQSGTITAGDSATLTAGTNLIQTGTVTATDGSASLTAVDNLTQSKIVMAGANATLTAVYGTLAQNGTVTAGGNAALTATGGSLNQAGTVTAGNDATLTAGTNLSQTGTVDASGGSASLMAVNNLTQSKIVMAGANAALTAVYGTLAQNGTVTAGGNATLTATGGSLNQAGTVTAGNDATLTAGTNLSQTGTVDAAGGSASLTAVDNLTQSAIVTAGTNVTLTATNGTLAQNGTVTAGGDATLTATNGPLDQFGIVTAGNSATLTAGTDLLQAGTVAATGGDATLAATGALTQSNLVTAGGNATLTATNGTLTQSSAVSAGGDATVTATNGTLDQFGTVTAGQSVMLTAGADLLQTGTVNAANGNATLTATGNLTQTNIVSAGGDATLSATDGTLTQSGTVTAGGNASLTATNGTLDQSGLVVAGGSANLTAGLDLSQTGAIHANGGDATFTAARNLTQSNTVTASNDATLTADAGDLTQTGSISAGTSAILQASAANLSDGGTITAPNIQLAARSGAVSFYGSFEGVQPDPTLNPQNKLKQGTFPTNMSIGAWISGSTITVAPTALVTGAGGGVSQLVIALTSPTGTVTFGNFNNTKTQLYLGLGTGFAAGQIEVDTLQVEYTPPGTALTINLTGTVNAQGGSTAASASFIQPLTKENYQVNGCPIESTSCIHITTLSLPTINPLKDLEVSTPEQADDILIILPDVGDRDY